jgi:hypothetical protein
LRNYFFFFKKTAMPIIAIAIATTKTYGRALVRLVCAMSGVVVEVVVGVSVGLVVGVGVVDG